MTKRLRNSRTASNLRIVFHKVPKIMDLKKLKKIKDDDKYVKQKIKLKSFKF